MKDEIKEILDIERYRNKDGYIENINLLPSEIHILLDYITNLEQENDYLKDIVSNTELSDEIKKADKWSKRELYKINFQRLQVNGRLREENERLKKERDKNLDNVMFLSKVADEKDEIINDAKRCLEGMRSFPLITGTYGEMLMEILKRKERSFTKEELKAEENYYKRHQVPFKENYKDYYKGSDE